MAALIPVCAVCGKHGEVQDRWCKTCKQFFCRPCIPKHWGHDKKKETFTIDNLRDINDQERNVEDKLTELKDQVEGLGDHHTDIKERIC